MPSTDQEPAKFGKKEFCESTGVVGLKECAITKCIWCKICWGIVLLFAFVSLSAQLTLVAKDYFDETVTTVMETWIPEELPLISLCPQKWWDPAKFAKSGIDADLMQYIEAFFSCGVHSKPNPNNTTLTPSRVESLKKTFEDLSGKIPNFETLVLSLAYDTENVIKDVSQFPTADHFMEAPISKTLNWFGVCFQIAAMRRKKHSSEVHSLAIPPGVLEFTNTLIHMNTKADPGLLQLFIGSRMEGAVFPGERDLLDPNQSYDVTIQLNKVVRYNRRLVRCNSSSEAEMSNMMLCIARAANMDPGMCLRKCHVYMPTTKASTTVNSSKYCNYYEVNKAIGLMQY